MSDTLQLMALPDSSVHVILQARIMEWIVIPFSRDWTQVSCIAGRFFTTSEAHGLLQNRDFFGPSYGYGPGQSYPGPLEIVIHYF